MQLIKYFCPEEIENGVYFVVVKMSDIIIVSLVDIRHSWWYCIDLVLCYLWLCVAVATIILYYKHVCVVITVK